MNKIKALQVRLNELEQDIEQALRDEIENSKTESEFVATKCIKVNVFDYKELAVIHGELTFMDSAGLQYGLYTECTLDDLIDILVKI
jgi:hypothetical protein